MTQPKMFHSFMILGGLVLAACASVEGRLVGLVAGHEGVAKRWLVDGWEIAGWVRDDGVGAVHIYIEGDGRAYAGAGVASGNPTPQQPVALELALADGARNVVYVARPCQWVAFGAQPCGPRVWTEERFGADKVVLYDKLVGEVGRGRPVTLVGYSGGAALALAVAVLRPEVVRVVTVAGNAEPAAVNRWHKVPVWPADVVPLAEARLKQVPWLVLMGGEDKVIPPALGRQMLDARGPWPCAQVQVVAATHNSGWVEKWPLLMNKWSDALGPSCQRGEKAVGGAAVGA